MKVFLSLLLLNLTFAVQSQSLIYIGSKSFPSTETMAFLKSGRYFGYEPDARLNVNFAKTQTGGYLMLSTSAYLHESISGPILIYLVDGNVISLNTRVNKDFVNDEAIAIFSIDKNQIEMLKSSDIASIRYNLVSTVGNKGFSATNKNLVNVNPNRYEVHETSKEIKRLFN